MDILNDVVERFSRYVRIDTQSREPENAEEAKRYPSTEKQKDLGRLLVEELKGLGLHDAVMDSWGYVMATLPSNVQHNVPVIGLIAHMDTSPAASGRDVEPIFHHNYQGGAIQYPSAGWQRLEPADNPELAEKIGHTIITSNGTTLLGADNKAGVSEIMSCARFFMEHPEIPHGTIRIGFTCDEEIGAGVDHFELNAFNAKYAYTVDGETVGIIENETFCADAATLTVTGTDIHPGFAKDRLVNAAIIAAEFCCALPRDKAPETTEHRQGYLHAYTINGGVDRTTVKLIIRDFEEAGLHALEEEMYGIVTRLRERYPKAELQLDVKEQYRNMRYHLEQYPEVMDYAVEAVRRVGLAPERGIIRGGTDGARLSAMGLPTPNIFTGGHNFHSTKEWISAQDMETTVKTLVELVKIWAEPK